MEDYNYQISDWLEEQDTENNNFNVSQYVGLWEMENLPEAARFPHIDDYSSVYGQYEDPFAQDQGQAVLPQYEDPFAQDQGQAMSPYHKRNNAMDDEHADEAKPGDDEDQLLHEDEEDESDDVEIELPVSHVFLF